MANPVFSNNKTFAGNQIHSSSNNSKLFEHFESLYRSPSATAHQIGRMTYDDVLIKTGVSLLTVFFGASIGWMIPGFGFLGALLGTFIGLYLSFSGKASKTLTLGYSLCQGVFAGSISTMLNARYQGVAVEALIGTFSIFCATLYFYKSGRFRTSPRLNKMFTIGMWGLLIFGVVNFMITMLGGMSSNNSIFGAYSLHIPGTSLPLGIILGLLSLAMGAYSLVIDFESIDNGIRAGASKEYSWVAAFGLILSMVWMYTELLRLLSIIRNEE